MLFHMRVLNVLSKASSHHSHYSPGSFPRKLRRSYVCVTSETIRKSRDPFVGGKTDFLKVNYSQK